MPKLVGFVATKGSGKTEAERALVDAGYAAIAFADPLREVVKTLFALTDEQCTCPALKEAPGALGVSYREGMQKIGTDVVRKQFADLFPGMTVPGGRLWIEHARRRVEALHAKGVNVVVTDVRFLDEARFVLDNGGRILNIRRCPEQLAAFYAATGWNAADAHASETGVGAIVSELGESSNFVVVPNKGSLADLHAAVRRAVE